MKKSEQTAVKTDLPETKGTVVLLASVKEAEAVPKPKGRPGRKPKAATAPETEKPTPQKAAADSQTEVKPKAGRKPKAESAPETGTPTPKTEAKPKTGRKPKAKSVPKTETPTPQKAEVDSGTEAKPKAGREPKAEPANTDKKTRDIPKVEPESAPAPDIPKTEPLPPPPSPAPAPPAVNPPVSVVESPLKLMKQEFTRRSNRIRKEMCNIQNSFVVIGFQLHWIKANNMYRVLNYKNICEYAEKEYNIKKSTCNNLISIIENFAERDESGEVIESITECYRNYSSTQLLAMIGMPEELQQQVTPDMSVRAIQRLRKGEPEKPPVDAEKATITDVKEPETPSADTGNAAVADVKEPVKPPEPVKERPVTAYTAPITGADPHTEKPPQETEKVPDKDSGVMNKDTKDMDADVDKDTAGKSNTGVPVSHPVNPAEPPEQNTHAEEPDGKDTVKLAEIDSYSTYKEMLGKLDIMMKHVFSGKGPVRVKIICVHG